MPILGQKMQFNVLARRINSGGSIAYCKKAKIELDTNLKGNLKAFNPAELLLVALSACMIKGIERVTPILKFDIRDLEVKMHGVRQDTPPRMESIQYEIVIDTDESDQRLALLHENVKKYGTVFNSVAPGTNLTGNISRRAYVNDSSLREKEQQVKTLGGMTLTSDQKMLFDVLARRISSKGSVGYCKEAKIELDTNLEGNPEAFNPAELLLAALSACMIKSIERVTPILKFDIRDLEVKMHGVRQDIPPRMKSIQYEIVIDTNEPDQRLALLHENVKKYGTVFNSVAPGTNLTGNISRRAYVNDSDLSEKKQQIKTSAKTEDGDNSAHPEMDSRSTDIKTFDPLNTVNRRNFSTQSSHNRPLLNPPGCGMFFYNRLFKTRNEDNRVELQNGSKSSNSR